MTALELDGLGGRKCAQLSGGQRRLLNSITVPLMLLSGILLPMTLGLTWLQNIAKVAHRRCRAGAVPWRFRRLGGVSRQRAHGVGRGGVDGARRAQLRAGERLINIGDRGSARAQALTHPSPEDGGSDRKRSGPTLRW